jgi:hypothetical protein
MFEKYPVIKISADQKKNIELYNIAIKDGKYKLEEVSCDLCGSNQKKVLFRNDRYGIDQNTVICMKCGLLYSSPRLTSSSVEKFYRSDGYRNIYEGESTQQIFLGRYKNAVSYKFNSFNPRKYTELSFVDFLNETGIAFNSVCEVGTGGGTNLIPFTIMGKEVAGIDYSEKLIDLGRKKGINIFQGSIEDMDKSYDLVILIHVLEHFLNPVEQIKKLRNYTNRYLFVEIPGMVNRLPSLQNAHFYYFSINTLFSCIYRAGFKAINYRTIDSNNYIMALFEKSNDFFYYYNFSNEINQVFGIIKRFKGKNFMKNIAKSIPFGNKLLNNLKSFSNKLRLRKF